MLCHPNRILTQFVSSFFLHPPKSLGGDVQHYMYVLCLLTEVVPIKLFPISAKKLRGRCTTLYICIMFINQSSSFPKLSHIYESTHRSIPSISEAFLSSSNEALLSITLEAFPIKVYEVLLNSSKHDTDKTSYTHHHVSPLNTQQ